MRSLLPSPPPVRVRQGFSVSRCLRVFQWLLPLLALQLSALSASAQVPNIGVRQGSTEIVDGGTMSYGAVSLGSSSTKTYTVYNNGTGLLVGISFSINGAHVSDYTHTFGNLTSLAAGGSYSFNVTFTPGAATTRTAAFHITSNSPGESPYDVNLNGMGTGPDIAVTIGNVLMVDGTSTVNFGKVRVGLSGNRLVAIRNTGNSTLSGLSISLSGSGYSITSLPVTSLAQNAVTNVTLSFTPASTSTSGGTLRIFSNDPNESPFDINLTGSGVIPLLEMESPPGTAVFDGSDFAINCPAGVQAQRQVLIRNVTSNTLTGLAVTIDGAGADKYSASALPSTSLNPGATMTFTLTFSPPELLQYPAFLNIAFDQSPGNPFSISLTGTGVALPDEGDEDGDGILNMLEAAMATDPFTADYNPGTLAKVGASLEFTITRSIIGQNTYNLWVEYADDPAGVWTSLDAGNAFLDNQVGDVQTLRYVFPAGDGRRFARIRATRQPPQ